MTFSIHGLAVARGIAIGRAVLAVSSRMEVVHYFIEPGQVEAEILRARRGRDAVAEELQRLQADMPHDAPPELAALLDVQQARSYYGHYLGAQTKLGLQRAVSVPVQLDHIKPFKIKRKFKNPETAPVQTFRMARAWRKPHPAGRRSVQVILRSGCSPLRPY